MASNDKISCAAELLRSGELVAFATETVYGLGADATNADAVAAVFEAKGRPRFNPLIIHVADVKAARRIVRFTKQADELAEQFWPGALTLVLPRTENCQVSFLASAGLSTLAVRIPSKESTHDFLQEAGVPVAAPSANKSGRVSPTEAAHVTEAFGNEISMILDDGSCPIGVESTVLDLTKSKPVILRHGGITLEEIKTVTGEVSQAKQSSPTIASPGMLSTHYATMAPLRLGIKTVFKDEALLAFGKKIPDHHGPMLNLSADRNLREAAANLFGMMRQLDKFKPKAIAAMPIPETGLGAAINDRLKRAASC